MTVSEHLQVSEFAEADVRVDGEGHEEDEGSIQENKPRLCNMRVICSTTTFSKNLLHIFAGGLTEQNQASRESSDNRRVSALLHNRIDNRDSQTSKNCGQSAHADIGNVVGGVAVADVLKQETPIEADKPTRQAKQQLCERWVHVEVVLVRDVVCCELAEVDFVEPMVCSGSVDGPKGLRAEQAPEKLAWDRHVHNLVWMANLVETESKCQCGQRSHNDYAALLTLEELLDPAAVPLRCHVSTSAKGPRDKDQIGLTGLEYTSAWCSSSCT